MIAADPTIGMFDVALVVYDVTVLIGAVIAGVVARRRRGSAVTGPRQTTNDAALRHAQTGVRKLAPLGFSWTTFFFSGFPALFRGDVKWALIMSIGWIAALAVSAFTFGIATPVLMLLLGFTYNKRYIKGLLNHGYEPADEYSQRALIGVGIIVGDVRAHSSHPDTPSNEKPQSIETAILRKAHQARGIVTPTAIAIEGGFSLGEAQDGTGADGGFGPC